uniref:Lipocalin/cytosolic fatty-acid binding domain-containing protein n=1 Tax=Suricata suricatta TaxID=37032 RepID=A0A673U1C5_SURSU
MALSLLWLGFALLGALQTQAQDSTPNLILAPPLLSVPVEPDFKKEEFQGKWYVIAVAGDQFHKERDTELKRYTNTYDLNKDNTYDFTSTLVRGRNCSEWTKVIIINLHVDQLNLGDTEYHSGNVSYITRVVTTDYNRFAIMFFKKVDNNEEDIKVKLYGRTKELPTVLRKIFINFAKSLGLTD